LVILLKCVVRVSEHSRDEALNAGNSRGSPSRATRLIFGEEKGRALNQEEKRYFVQA